MLMMIFFFSPYLQYLFLYLQGSPTTQLPSRYMCLDYLINQLLYFCKCHDSTMSMTHSHWSPPPSSRADTLFLYTGCQREEQKWKKKIWLGSFLPLCYTFLPVLYFLGPFDHWTDAAVNHKMAISHLIGCSVHSDPLNLKRNPRFSSFFLTHRLSSVSGRIDYLYSAPARFHNASSFFYFDINVAAELVHFLNAAHSVFCSGTLAFDIAFAMMCWSQD